jgi:hypothetical protein
LLAIYRVEYPKEGIRGRVFMKFFRFILSGLEQFLVSGALTLKGVGSFAGLVCPYP